MLGSEYLHAVQDSHGGAQIVLSLKRRPSSHRWLALGALPKYYFRDIPAEVMKEIMDKMLAAKPEPSLADPEEVDDWLNRHNVASTIPAWYKSVGEFLSDVRYECR